MNENWLDVKGYEGLYKVSSDGEIYSVKRKKKLSLVKNKQTGYYKVNLSKDGISKTKYIHRIVAEAFIPNPEGLPQIDHIDRNKANNCVSNLRWVSRKQNLRNTSSNRKVINLDTNTMFDSIAEAAETV